MAVMYEGEIVQSGEVDDVLTNPTHEYAQALIAAVPRIDLGDDDPRAGQAAGAQGRGDHG